MTLQNSFESLFLNQVVLTILIFADKYSIIPEWLVVRSIAIPKI